MIRCYKGQRRIAGGRGRLRRSLFAAALLVALTIPMQHVRSTSHSASPLSCLALLSSNH